MTYSISRHEKRTINKWMPILVNLNYQGNKYCELCFYCEYSSWEYENAMRDIFSWWGVMHNLGGFGLMEIYRKQEEEMRNYKGELPQNTLPLSLRILTKIKSLDDYNVEFDALSNNEVTEYIIDVDVDFELDEKDFEYNRQVDEKIVEVVAPIIDKNILSKKDKKSFSLSTVVFNTKWLVKSYKMKDKKTISVVVSYGLKKNI